MGREFGRISGPLLADNLKRNGVDLAFESQLLYLDVRNNRIGVNANLVTTGPSVDLYIPGTTDTTNLIVDTEADIANFIVSNSQFQNILSSITISPNQSSNPTITTPNLSTDNFLFSATSVSNTTSNSNINLTPGAGAQVVFTTTKVNVNGNLHATGDITWDGNITIGDSNSDTVTFDAKVTSNVIPSADNRYNLGAVSDVWSKLYTTNLNSDSLVSNSLIVNNINLTLSPGNVVYVSINGNDSSSGVHAHAPVRTIAHALSIATSGTEIVVFPGTYTEIFPLTIPQGVSVRGTSIRAVKIQPTVGTKSNDAFLLNSDTTVSFLTVANFYFNSSSNTGYAFKLANSFKLISRSPYIYNVSVITSGSVTTLQDPLGFNQADAGAGAYIDGSVADPTSTQASCLFYAVTFIVPNAIGIQATNGARIEVINSFTYYASKGLYLTEGTLGFSNLGVRFGAELRGINNASVYGTYGAVADGANTLGYVMNHNFAYVGTGSDSSNNHASVIQANEVVEIHGGILKYESTDQLGDFRIGNVFYVQQSTGNVYFNAQAINFSAAGSIGLDGVNGFTLIQAADVEVANLRFRNNTIDSFTGPVNFLAYSGTTTLNTNVNITGNLSVTGDTTIHGNITFGNAPSDIVTVTDYLTQTVKPDLNNQFALGSNSATWRTIYSSLADFGLVQISGNTITTTQSSTDLLIQSSSGNVNVEYLKFSDNSISNIWPTPTTDIQQSILLSPNGFGNVVVNSSKSVVLPIGNDSSRILTANGEIRYNSSFNNIEGYESSGYVNFFNLYSQNRQTYITGELTPNLSDDTLRFAVNNTVTTTVDSAALTTIKLISGNIASYQNIIQSTDSSNNVFLVPNGSGIVNLNNFVTIDSTQDISNTSGTALTMLATGTGHWKFSGNNGVVIPLGTNTNHPTTPVEGTVRFNTDINAGEIYSNVYGWMPWIGKANTVVTRAEDEDLSLVYTLMLGL